MSSLCEGNYLRLMKLVPAEDDERSFLLGSSQQGARVRIVIEEDHRYTTMLSVYQEGLSPEWLQPLSMQVRLYHDALMAEVTGYQNQRRFEGRYTYPNPGMRMPDEKVQLNRFLAEWLEHCIRHGRIERNVVLPGQFTED